MLATFVLTITGLTRAPLWRDELATWSAASRGPVDLLRLTATIDGVSGPYYLLMQGWLWIFGDSVLALRMPAALAMTATAGLTAGLGSRLFDRRVGLLAGLLFVVVPSTSRYGQEARPYALATLLAVVATLLLVRALRRPTWRNWAGYSAAVAWLGLAHLVAVGLVAGHAVAVGLAWWRRRDRRLSRWPAALVPAVALVAPLALLGRAQQSRQLAWVQPPGLADLPGLPGAVLQSGAVGGLLVGLAALGALSGEARRRPRGASGGDGRRALGDLRHGAGPHSPLGDLRHGAGPHSPLGHLDTAGWRWALAAAVLLPTALLFAAGLVTPLWVPRYLVFVVPFGCVLAATALARVTLLRALPIVVVAGLLGAGDQLGLRETHEWPRTAPVDYPQAARIIAAGQRPGDGIIFSPRADWAFLDTAIAYHLRGEQPRDVLLARDPVRRADLFGSECVRPVACLAGVPRVWVLARGERDDPLAGMTGAKAAVLRTDFELVQVWPVPGLTVALLRR